MKEKKIGDIVNDPMLNPHIIAAIVIAAIGVMMIIAGVIVRRFVYPCFTAIAANNATLVHTANCLIAEKILVLGGAAGTLGFEALNWSVYAIRTIPPTF